MPISSGANRWPKSYWSKPPPRSVTVKPMKVAEQQSIRHPRPRAVSLSSDVDNQWKLDNGFQSESSPDVAHDSAGLAVKREPLALRSAGVVIPLSVERQDAGETVRSQSLSSKPPVKRVESGTATTGESSSSISPTVYSSKRTYCSPSVSQSSSSHCASALSLC